eukprot:Selendium_serpulae@DN6337_c2_g2_i5.p1
MAGNDIANLDAFIAAFAAGSAEEHRKTQFRSAVVASYDVEPTAEQKPFVVKDFVGLDYDGVILDENKHVFVEYYAPWCNHCQTLKPLWEKMAIAAQSRYPELTVARLDCTTNDCPDKVEGFPTLRYYPKGPKKLRFRETYDGPRTVNDMMDYLEEMMETADEADVSVEMGRHGAEGDEDEL